MGGLSAWHWLIVIGAFVLLFGAQKLPDAARSLGRSTRILKAELSADATPGPAPAPSPAPTPSPAPSADSTVGPVGPVGPVGKEPMTP